MTIFTNEIFMDQAISWFVTQIEMRQTAQCGNAIICVGGIILKH